MRLLAFTLALIVSTLFMLQPSAADAQPEVTYLFPNEEDVLAEPPTLFRMCFASPINILDLHLGGDFSFKVVAPDGTPRGLRIVFQPDGLGVDIIPGLPANAPEGDWLFEWRVTEPETLEPATGSAVFTVGADGSPPSEPKTCRDLTPVTEMTPTETPAAAEAEEEVEEDDDGLGTLAISLIAAGSLAGAAVTVGLILYLIRRRKP